MDMTEIKSFIIQYWKEMVAVLLFIISTIIGFISKRKKGYTVSDILLGLLTKELPDIINKAEDFFGKGHGEQKKVLALNEALSFVSKKLGRKLSEEETSLIITYAEKEIEKILKTPQSGEAKDKEPAKKSKYR